MEVRRRNGSYVLTVASHDKPFLLASTAGALAAVGLSLLWALPDWQPRNSNAVRIVANDPE